MTECESGTIRVSDCAGVKRPYYSASKYVSV